MRQAFEALIAYVHGHDDLPLEVRLANHAQSSPVDNTIPCNGRRNVGVTHLYMLTCSLKKLQAAVGGSGPSEEVLSQLLAADFDPDNYDKMMSEAFNEDFYEVCFSHHCL